MKSVRCVWLDELIWVSKVESGYSFGLDELGGVR